VRFQEVDRLAEVERILKNTDNKTVLDILHFLRIQYADELFDVSRETFKDREKKMQNIPDSSGVYFIVIIDPKGDVILYPGKTGGKSKTSGLRFRLRDHVRFLGKTPLTLFIPSWWIKRVYPIPIDEKDKVRELEKGLWTFLKRCSETKYHFDSLSELEDKISETVRQYVKSSDRLEFVELQASITPRKGFILKIPPAGSPRGFFQSR
jgi:hypothetical protein